MTKSTYDNTIRVVVYRRDMPVAHLLHLLVKLEVLLLEDWLDYEDMEDTLYWLAQSDDDSHIGLYFRPRRNDD